MTTEQLIPGAPLFALGLILLFWGQRQLAASQFRPEPLPLGGLLIWLTGLLLIVLLHALSNPPIPLDDVTPVAAPTRRVISERTVLVRGGLALGSLLCSLYAWSEVRERLSGESHTDIMMAWISANILAIAAVSPCPTRPDNGRIMIWIRRHAWELGCLVVITIVGFILRFVTLERYPWIFNADEAKFGTVSREVLSGQLRNPFETTFDGHPTLWLFVQAEVMQVFGNDVVGARMLSVLLGTLTIPVVYLLMRQLTGPWPAIAASGMVAIFHFHIFLSRNAQNNIWAPFFTVLLLLVLARLITTWRVQPALLTGIVIGLGQYSYVSNRLLAPIAAATVSIVLVGMLRRDLRTAGRRAVVTLVTVVAGLATSIAPLAAYYADNWVNFGARTNIISIFGNGWLDRERESTGHSSVHILWDQFVDSALLPFHTSPGGFYLTPVPFAGWPLALLGAVGLTIVTCQFWQPRYTGFAVAWWVGVAGLAITEPPPATNRFSLSAALLPSLAGIGIVALASVTARFSTSRALIPFAVAASLVITAIPNIQFVFDPDDPWQRSTDYNTLITATFARHLQELGPGYTIYYGAAPQLFYRGHLNMEFLNPTDTAIDLVEPLTAATPPPVITGPTIYFFLPARTAELAIVQSWFPGGTVTTRTDEMGRDLYTSYEVPQEATIA